MEAAGYLDPTEVEEEYKRRLDEGYEYIVEGQLELNERWYDCLVSQAEFRAMKPEIE